MTLAAAPTIVSESAPAHPKATEARLEAVVNPNNETTEECKFEYGETTSYGSELPCEPAVLEGYGEQGVGATATGLTQDTTYDYRIVVKNATGIEEGTGHFATALPPETPVTLKAEPVTGTTATLKGELNPTVSATDGYFFTYDNNGTCEPAATTAPGTEVTGTKVKVSTPVSELEGSTEYTFCVTETNAAGESATGTALKFKTPTATPVIPTREHLRDNAVRWRPQCAGQPREAGNDL